MAHRRADRRDGPFRSAAAALLFVAAYVVLADLCQLFVVPPFESAMVWLPGGLTLGVALLVPRDRWPHFLVIAWSAEFLSVSLHGQPLPVALMWGTGTMLRTALGSFLVRRWARGEVDLGRLRDFGGLVVFGAGVAPLGSATLGVLATALLYGEGAVGWSFAVWWISDAMGILLFAPLVLTWWPLPRLATARKLAEWLALMGLVLAAAALAFSGNVLMVLPYVPLLALIVAGIRLGPRGGATGLVLLGAIAIWRTWQGVGLYGSLPLGPVVQLLSVQVYLGVAAVSVLGLAAALQERRQIGRLQQILADVGATVSESLDYRQSFQRTASLIVPAVATGFAAWVKGDDGRVEFVAREGLSEEELRRLADALETAERRRTGPDVTPCTVLSALEGEHGTLGGLALIAQRRRAAGAQEITFAKDLARRFSNALEKIRLVSELERVARLREDFIMVAAHELRTPITPLLLQLQRLRRAGDAEGGETDPKLADAVRYVKRLARLVDVLIAATAVKSGRLEVKREPLELTELVRSLVSAHMEALERAACTPVLRLEPPVFGLWDRARLEEMFTTLLSNAIKFGAGKPVEIRVWSSDGRARLVMRDHGIGISPEVMGRIFSPFEQGVAPREYGGLGLGLYLAREIAEAHGGTVHAAATEGGGATIVVDLPALPAPGPEVEQGPPLP